MQFYAPSKMVLHRFVVLVYLSIIFCLGSSVLNLEKFHFQTKTHIQVIEFTLVLMPLPAKIFDSFDSFPCHNFALQSKAGI